MSKEVFMSAPDGFMPDGTPIYIQMRQGIPPSSLQLQIYAALHGPNKPESKEVLEWLRKNAEGR